MISFILLFLILVCFIIIVTYVYSNYNKNYFHVLNVIFFMTFIISMYSFYLQEKQHNLETVSRYISIILQDLYDAERQPENYLFILLLVEKISLFDKTLFEPKKLGLRLSLLVSPCPFQQFWKDRQDVYPTEMSDIITRLKKLGGVC